jgi:phenylalanyl-tRNA synthetase alpha chain
MNNPDQLLQHLQTDLSHITSLSTFQDIETNYLGRNGLVNQAMQNIKHVPTEEKKAYGAKMNQIKDEISRLLFDKKHELIQKEEASQYVDITLPGKQYPKGSVHMVTLAIEEISSIFEKIGFIRMTYPEIEWEYFGFDALNMQPNHPARDDFETFFVDTPAHKEFGKMILTPHTSSGQNREMKRLGKPPIRMINIGKTYRPNWDASHVPMFHQFEGLCVDKDINITHLKGTIDHFAKQFFGETRETRLRPFHFQFTEPSFEVDITCGVCNGTGYVISNEVRNPTNVNSQREPSFEDPKTGPSTPLRSAQDDLKVKCKLCKSGWLELGGSGMVHPNVLKAGGIDPEEYTGWAFGFGVERVMMMKEGLKLDDIRVMYNGDIRFLEQF